MVKRAVFCVFVVVLIFSLSGCATFERGMAVFYVAPNGSDTNAGTKAETFLTLDQARITVREQLQAGQP